MQTPKGYYTSTETKKILNISGAMIASHVEKGKIHYLLPPGRKHGFYLKKDVDKLANELGSFFNLEEETESSKFMIATEKDLPRIPEISLFTGEEHNSRILLGRMATWIRKNPEIIYMLKKEDEVIGYAVTLPLRPGSPKLQEILSAELLGEVDITADDIEVYKPDTPIQLYIAGVGVKPSIEKSQRRRYGAALVGSLISKIAELGSKGVLLESVIAAGATTSGIRLLQHFGFSEILPPKPGKRIFSIKVEESGAPVSIQYRRELQEWREEHKS
jgi:hypothetical protein